MMNKPNDRLIRSIVAGGSLLAIIVVGLPLTDEYYRLREDHRALTELEHELETIQARDVRLRRIEAKLTSEQNDLVLRATTPDQIQRVRDEVIGVVRDCNAKLRSLEIEDGNKRRWAIEGDDPLSRRIPDLDMESEFELHSHTLHLIADGSLDSVMGVVRKIRDHGWLMTVETLGLKPVGVDDSVIGLELRLVLYGLQKSPKPDEDTFAMVN